MKLKSEVRRFIERITNTQILKNLPRGLDLHYDVKRLLPRYSPDIIFDVGANLGQSVEQYLKWFPQAQVHCFEPVKSTFEQLEKSYGKFENVECYQLAFGASHGEGKVLLQEDSDLTALISDSEIRSVSDDSMIESIQMEALSEFCETNGFERISFLKIDTEGHDLEVLKGAGSMLEEGKIDVIEVEAGMNPENKTHVSFELLKKYVKERGYSLFGIYEQMHEWPTNMPQLRRANLVFVSPHMIEINAGIIGQKA